jgi:hypothetical protein
LRHNRIHCYWNLDYKNWRWHNWKLIDWETNPFQLYRCCIFREFLVVLSQHFKFLYSFYFYFWVNKFISKKKAYILYRLILFFHL